MKSSMKVFGLLALLPLSALGQSLQCGEKWVTAGTSQAEVAAQCGQPTQIDHQRNYGETGTVAPPAPGPLGALPPIGVRSGDETSVEIWTYNFGPNRLMQRIRFENGVVVKIESLGYGS